MTQEHLDKNVGTVRAYIILVKEVWNTFGLPTILLCVIFGLWIGWLPSPVSEARAVVGQIHDTLLDHGKHDAEIIFYLRQTCIIHAKEAGLPVDTCYWRP